MLCPHSTSFVTPITTPQWFKKHKYQFSNPPTHILRTSRPYQKLKPRDASPKLSNITAETYIEFTTPIIPFPPVTTQNSPVKNQFHLHHERAVSNFP